MRLSISVWERKKDGGCSWFPKVWYLLMKRVSWPRHETLSISVWERKKDGRFLLWRPRSKGTWFTARKEGSREAEANRMDKESFPHLSVPGQQENSIPNSTLLSLCQASVPETTRDLVLTGEVSSMSWHCVTGHNPPRNLQEEILNLSVQLSFTVMWQHNPKASSAGGIQRIPYY